MRKLFVNETKLSEINKKKLLETIYSLKKYWPLLDFISMNFHGFEFVLIMFLGVVWSVSMGMFLNILVIMVMLITISLWITEK